MAVIVSNYFYQQKIERLEEELHSLENQLAREENSLNTIYQTIDSKILNTEIIANKTKLKANQALKAIVCSDANRYNNEANEQYLKYCTYVSSIKKELPSYYEKYEELQSLNDKIVEIQKELGFEESSYSHLSVISYANVSKQCKEIFSEEDILVKAVKASQEYADKLYREYYPLCLRLTNAEAGSPYCPNNDQYYIINVVENRVKSKHFPNTVRKVIFQKGQYAPTWDGSWNKKADKRTKENVRKYLRGEIKTGMPKNVVFQAMFIQGDYVWAHVSNSVDGGHYYCAKK